MVTAPAPVYGAGTALRLKTIDGSAFPAARCNDGTLGAYYVHRASSATDEDKWVIYLQGGFSCATYEDCRLRWCGETGLAADVNGQLMSTRWLDPTIGGYGILHSLLPAGNTFATWNHVLIHYCSSDRWTGRKGRSILTDGTDLAVTNFRGRNILRATVLELLDAAGVTSDDGLETMPSLANAAVVLWTGTSAGGVGAAQSANPARDEILVANPSVDFRLVVDGAYASPDPLWDAALASVAAAEFPGLQTAWNVQLDPACEAAHPGSEWDCTSREVLRSHVSFPFFVRQDMSDNVAVSALAALVGATDTDLIAATEAEFLSLNTVADASYYGSCSPTAGHVWLTTALKYAADSLVSPSTVGATTMNAAMAEWMATGGPVRWYDVPNAAGGCPP